jgi:deoxyribose-phosphate aldolase
VDLRPYIEQTILRPDLTGNDIEDLIQDALEHCFLSICVPPFWVEKAARDLKSTTIKVVTVVGYPNGYSRTESKISDIECAISDGANELDVVMNISSFKTGMSWTKIELAKCSKLIHESECLMSAIIETSLLSDEEIVKACKICEEAGVDFVKTSTELASAGAKVEHIKLIKEALSDHSGIKASGGIKTRGQAISLIEAGADRIGTSSGTLLISS